MKQVKYYTELESPKVEEQTKLKLTKLNKRLGLLNEKADLLMKHPKREKLRIQKRLVKLSIKITKTEIKIKHLNRKLDLLNDNKLIKEPIYIKVKKWFSNIEYRKQTIIWGIVFILPWLFGMLVLFLPSIFQTLLWSMSRAELTPEGMKLTFIGIDNYKYLFTEYVIDVTNVFSVSLLTFMQGLIIDLPVIIIFSILIAVLLNKEFKGYKIIRAIFFIPIIYNLAVITETLTGVFGQHVSESMTGELMFVNQLTGFFREIGLADSMTNIVLNAVSRIFIIVNMSGIQILIFVAAIQSIPNHLYEAAQIEGATKYEIFWKITIAMITPMILTASVYTIVDSFGRAPIFRFLNYSVSAGNYGLAAAISMSYFVINVLIVGAIFLLFKGRVFYYDE